MKLARDESIPKKLLEHIKIAIRLIIKKNDLRQKTILKNKPDPTQQQHS